MTLKIYLKVFVANQIYWGHLEEQKVLMLMDTLWPDGSEPQQIQDKIQEVLESNKGLTGENLIIETSS